jgi:hypothetical protein
MNNVYDYEIKYELLMSRIQFRERANSQNLEQKVCHNGELNNPTIFHCLKAVVPILFDEGL